MKSHFFFKGRYTLHDIHRSSLTVSRAKKYSHRIIPPILRERSRKHNELLSRVIFLSFLTTEEVMKTSVLFFFLWLNWGEITVIHEYIIVSSPGSQFWVYYSFTSKMRILSDNILLKWMEKNHKKMKVKGKNY